MVPILGIIFLNALICAGIAIYFYAKTFNGNIIAEHDKWGALGDFFGGVLNPAFSLLALLALLLTIILQSKELSLATAEYTKSTQALVDQSNSMKKQSFEQTFFQLLIAHNQIVNGIDLKKNGLVTTTGRDCFRVFYDRLQKLYESRSKKSNNTDDLEFVKIIYKELYNNIQHDTGHYFLFLYNILKFVHEKCENEDPKFYTNLIRAQLSYDELALIFYNCISVVRPNKFKPLIENYGIFKNLPIDTLIHHNHLSFYEKEAYQ